MDERDATNALGWVAAASAFAVYQFIAWVARRGQWSRRRLPNSPVPPPRFLEPLSRSVAAFLLDMRPVIAAVLPMLAGGAWLIFCFAFILAPLAAEYGPIWGAAGGLVAAAVGMVFGIKVLIAVGEEGRIRDRYKAASLLAASRPEPTGRDGGSPTR